MASIPAILPTSVASGIWTGAQKKSAILAVANVRPQKFGNVKFMRLTAPPKAEIVGAGAAKGASGGTLAALILRQQAAPDPLDIRAQRIEFLGM